MSESLHSAESAALTPAQIVSMEYEGYLHSDRLDPAWVAGWHAAINHATAVLTRVTSPAVQTHESPAQPEG